MNRPFLFLDIDGVLNRVRQGRPSQVLEMPQRTPERVSRLLEAFEPVWATEWHERANTVWLPQLRLNERKPWPWIDCNGPKVLSILAYAGDRKWAWVDDRLSGDCPSGYLMIKPKPYIGLTDDHVEQLLSFAHAQNPESDHTSPSAAGPQNGSQRPIPSYHAKK